MKADTGSLASIPLWILMHPNIPASAIRLWGVLHAKYTIRTPDEPVADPTRGELARDLRCSVDSIDRRLKALVTEGALVVIPQTTPTNQRTQNRYLLVLSEGRRAAATGAEEMRPPQAIIPFRDSPLELTASPVRSQVSVPKRSTVQQYVRFREFWAAYPRKHRKQRAQVVWLKLGIEGDTPLWVQVMAGLRQWKNLWKAEATKTQYIPHPSTWLNDRRWEDDIDQPSPVLSAKTKTLIAGSQQFLARHQRGEHKR